MLKEKPLVSVCLPIYNGEKFLLEALKSIKNQTYTNIELIISDDASIDNSLGIIEDFAKIVVFPISIFHHTPKGIGENWNNCVKKSKGQYIKFIFQDDVLENNCIEKMVNLAVTDSKIGLVFCRRNFIYDDNNSDHLSWIKKFAVLDNNWDSLIFDNNKIINGKLLLKDKKLFSQPSNKIGEPTAVLLNKDCFNKVGFFDKELKQSLDYEYWYRLMKFYKVGFLKEKLISFRLHNEQATFVNKQKSLNEKEIYNLKIYKNLYWQLNLDEKFYLFKKYTLVGRLLVNLKKLILK